MASLAYLWESLPLMADADEGWRADDPPSYSYWENMGQDQKKTQVLNVKPLTILVGDVRHETQIMVDVSEWAKDKIIKAEDDWRQVIKWQSLDEHRRLKRQIRDQMELFKLIQKQSDRRWRSWMKDDEHKSKRRRLTHLHYCAPDDSM